MGMSKSAHGTPRCAGDHVLERWSAAVALPRQARKMKVKTVIARVCVHVVFLSRTVTLAPPPTLDGNVTLVVDVGDSRRRRVCTALGAAPSGGDERGVRHSRRRQQHRVLTLRAACCARVQG
jgi:hypothetical protein